MWDLSVLAQSTAAGAVWNRQPIPAQRGEQPMTGWGIIAYSVVPLGILLMVLLLSDINFFMYIAQKVLSAPVSIGSLRLNVAVIASSFCACLTLLSYAAVRRSMTKYHAAQPQVMPLRDYDKMKMFYDERNFWISVVGLLARLSSWRLEALYRKRFEMAAAGTNRPSRSVLSRLSWIVAGCGVLLLADLPLCRANYKMQLSLHVTPGKEELLPAASACEGVFLRDAGTGCADFCQQVRLLSEERQSCVLFARKWHLLGRWAAQLFDQARDVQQDQSHVDKLFAKKTCAEVLRSVDRSNEAVDFLCSICAVLALLLAFAAFAQGLQEFIPQAKQRKD